MPDRLTASDLHERNAFVSVYHPWGHALDLQGELKFTTPAWAGTASPARWEWS